jgi:hypothetical protein
MRFGKLSYQRLERRAHWGTTRARRHPVEGGSVDLQRLLRFEWQLRDRLPRWPDMPKRGCTGSSSGGSSGSSASSSGFFFGRDGGRFES